MFSAEYLHLLSPAQNNSATSKRYTKDTNHTDFMNIPDSNLPGLLQTPSGTKFHIESGDYFAFIATLMGYLEEASEKCEQVCKSPSERQLAHELRQDLRFVHANYKIVPRDFSEIQPVRPSGNVLENIS